MTYARDLILTLTILSLIYTADNWPKPVKQVDPPSYCLIDYKAARRHPLTGEWQTGWARGYGPCALLNRFENI